MTQNLKGIEVTKARLDETCNDWKERKLQSVIKKSLWSREGNIPEKPHNRHLQATIDNHNCNFFFAARGDL